MILTAGQGEQEVPDEALKEQAVRFAKDHKKEIALRLTSTDLFPSEREPVAIFMARSPGAGKTESSIELIANVGPILRVDPDELRAEFPDYNGTNAHIFQGAVSILVEKILDMAFKNRQTFLLDGTLTNEGKAESNIDRAARKGRTVQILFVYQDPCQAWQFVQAREAVDGRRIDIETFIYQYFEARRVVNAMKEKFGSRILVDLLWKNNDGKQRSYEANIRDIDHHCPEAYDENQLRIAISTMQVANELSSH
jgi:UDP-N-acetylglucosamine kinase